MPAQAKGKKSKKTVENLTQRLALVRRIWRARSRATPKRAPTRRRWAWRQVMKSGKSSLGYKSSMKQLRQGRAKLVIVSSNIAPVRWRDVRRRARK